MAHGTGRPLAALVMSDGERSFLEAQVRRHRVARSLSDHCRMILRCADGPSNKAVAAEIGVNAHTVGKWRRRFLEKRLHGLQPHRRARVEEQQPPGFNPNGSCSNPASAA